MISELAPEEQAHVWAVFLHNDDRTRWRYIPQWQNDGSWKVWDRRRQKVILAEELFAIPLLELRDEQFLS